MKDHPIRVRVTLPESHGLHKRLNGLSGKQVRHELLFLAELGGRLLDSIGRQAVGEHATDIGANESAPAGKRKAGADWMKDIGI